MAKKYSVAKRRGSKIEPAPQTLFIPGTVLTTVPAGGGRTSFYIDLSQIASLVNRRFYRQGINWAIAGIKFQTGITSGSIEINKLPNTWVMSNAWEKGFRAWQRMNREAADETESVMPRFHDFKVFADAEHAAKGVAANLLPSGGNPSALSIYTPGMWEMSEYKIVTSPGDVNVPYEIIATGASFPGGGFTGKNSVSLIEGYAASRALPDIRDPNMPVDSSDLTGLDPENWIQALFDDGTNQDAAVIAEMLLSNNRAPYPFEGDTLNPDTMYPGGANQAPGLQLHDSAYWTNTAQFVNVTHRIKGGNFPCGLIKINATNTGDSDGVLHMQIDLIPGEHRGYLCEPMTEM